jgi:transposase
MPIKPLRSPMRLTDETWKKLKERRKLYGSYEELILALLEDKVKVEVKTVDNFVASVPKPIPPVIQTSVNRESFKKMSQRQKHESLGVELVPFDDV